MENEKKEYAMRDIVHLINEMEKEQEFIVHVEFEEGEKTDGRKETL